MYMNKNIFDISTSLQFSFLHPRQMNPPPLSAFLKFSSQNMRKLHPSGGLHRICVSTERSVQWKGEILEIISFATNKNFYRNDFLQAFVCFMADSNFKLVLKRLDFLHTCASIDASSYNSHNPIINKLFSFLNKNSLHSYYYLGTAFIFVNAWLHFNAFLLRAGPPRKHTSRNKLFPVLFAWNCAGYS